MGKYQVNTTYEPFSREPEYIEGNRAFIKTLPFKSAKRVLDLACGTGVISNLILEIQKNISIFGVDISRESLHLGQKDFLEKGLTLEDQFVLTNSNGNSKTNVVLLEGMANSLPLKDNWADVVFMGHSIHMIHTLPALERLLEEIYRVLVPGGLFAFNSSFYAGSQAPGTDSFYQFWWKKALAYIIEKDAEERKQGLPGIKRKRGTAPKAFSSLWLSKEEWDKLLGKHKFKLNTVNERPIIMTQSSLETIGSYSGLAELMISGYPVELASEALVFAVAPALEAAKMQEVPRLWLEMTVNKI
jgi:Methylase involved in ubiquinone/menaquinone biosynthesis